MLSEKELLKKLYTQPEIFMEHMANKEYAQADYCVECARNMAFFMELSDAQIVELFGSREDPENVVEGLFPEEKVLRAMEWCIFHNRTRQDLTEKDRKEREEAWRENTASMPAKEYLTRLKKIDELIATIYAELSQVEQSIAPSVAKMEEAASATNGISNPTEEKAVKLAELQEQLASYREEYVEMKTTATRLINKMKNNRYQVVLYKYYLMDMTLYETAEFMGLSYQHVSTLRNKAVKEFQKLMDEEGITFSAK